MFFNKEKKQMKKIIHTMDEMYDKIQSALTTGQRLDTEVQYLHGQYEAMIEALKGDRKDINAIIQLVKKSTKGKKVC